MNEAQHTDRQFAEIVDLIASARQRAFQAVNTALIDLYWQVGAIISRKIEAAEWGDGVVTQLAQYLAHTQPGLRGFTSRNLFRMRKFHEAYRDHELVTAAPSLIREEAATRSTRTAAWNGLWRCRRSTRCRLWVTGRNLTLVRL